MELDGDGRRLVHRALIGWDVADLLRRVCVRCLAEIPATTPRVQGADGLPVCVVCLSFDNRLTASDCRLLRSLQIVARPDGPTDDDGA